MQHLANLTNCEMQIPYDSRWNETSLSITFIFKSRKEVSLSVVFALLTWINCWTFARDNEYIVKVSRGIV